MEPLVAAAIGLLTACGMYLMLRGRTFPLVLGLTLLSYAANLFVLAMGRLAVGVPPLVADGVSGHADPLPQAAKLIRDDDRCDRVHGPDHTQGSPPHR